MPKSHYKIALLILLLFTYGHAQNESTPSGKQLIEGLIADSLWFKTYQKLNNNRVSPIISGIYADASAHFDLENKQVRLFSMLLQNYACDSLVVDQFLDRYPFASPRCIEENFNALVQKKLFHKTGTMYSLSARGKEVAAYLKVKIKSHPEKELDTMITILSKITENAQDVKSLANRQNASMRFKNDAPQFAQLLTVLGDLVAIRNDLSHYRYKYYGNTSSLNAPEEEIMASAFSYGFFKSDGFETRPTWGYTKQETLSFLANLENEKLLVQKDSVWKITEKGKEIEKELTQKMEWEFYKPWSKLSALQLQKLKNHVRS